MKRVCIESPYAGDVEANLAYLRRCLRHSLCNGEAPFASHAIYTLPGVLDDDDPEERLQGIKAGLAFVECCDLTAVYADRGISRGMQMGIDAAIKAGRKVVYRRFVDTVMCNLVVEASSYEEVRRLYYAYIYGAANVKSD